MWGPTKKYFVDTGSGAKPDRESLEKLISKLREGDLLIIWKLDRITRSVRHLTQLVNNFKENEIDLRSIREPFLNTTSPYGKFIFTIFSGITELERNILIERTIAGQESARRRGVKIGR
ncbi:recombinase family protein [Aquimarina agarilytica]|uniref:recombinase family protein n=1 Tax=Aquimarina agarilytica TaxID=1087449 RepID=UPI0009DA424F